ncbi:hypothetical protein BT69DRAFT_321076 [Atractiella rhizophila]|nr:hypothetical protein BT69DRAFT_321076 [Atractiella rhizophila]
MVLSPGCSLDAVMFIFYVIDDARMLDPRAPHRRHAMPSTVYLESALWAPSPANTVSNAPLYPSTSCVPNAKSEPPWRRGRRTQTVAPMSHSSSLPHNLELRLRPLRTMLAPCCCL